MILKALYDYYHRSGDLPPMGFDDKELYFIFIIDQDGSLINIEDTREGKTPKKFRVPRDNARTSGIKPNLLWDSIEYVLGIPKELTAKEKSGLADEEIIKLEQKAIQDAIKKQKSFIDNCKMISESMPDVVEFKAICSFYEKGINDVPNHPKYEDILKERIRYVSFQLHNATEIIPSIDEVKSLLTKDENTSTEKQYCLVTGKKDIPIRIAGKTALNKALLVSFQENSGYDSYGKEKCYNAPIGQEAESAITAAINTLLAKNSRNKYPLANRTFLFWASKTTETSLNVEESFFSFLQPEEDDPNRCIRKVRQALMAVNSGQKYSDDSDKFFILGVYPNKSRVVVVYWNECTVKEFAGKILRHFDDMEIIDRRKEIKPYQGIKQILKAVSLKGELDNAQPNLPEAILKSIVEGTPYPFTLYSSCIRRLNAEMSKKDSSGKLINPCTIVRMAIVKAYINRIKPNTLHIMIDKDNTDIAYLCGRLFAVLERIQYTANKIETIRERYMSAASTTPSSVFSTLLNLSIHHTSKIEEEGIRVYYDKIKGEIIDKIPSSGFPANLDLVEQGKFFVGYYHQRQDFFSKTENK